MKNEIRALVGFMLCLIVAIYWIVLRFQNPDMTEMRLIMEYYKELIVSLLIVGAGAFIIHRIR